MNLYNLFEGLKDPKDNPCWKGYHPVGTKQKDGRTVPNCVPAESVEEDLSRRGFLKGAAAAAGLGAAGYGAYKLDQWDTEQENKFMSLIKDPADIEKYKKLRSEANMYMAMSSGQKNSGYSAMATIKAAEADDFRHKLAKKYNIDLNWIGNVKDKEEGVDEARVGNRMSDMKVGSPKIVYKNGRAVGEIGIDHDPSPGNGPYYMKHYETNTWYSGYNTKKEALEELKYVVHQMNDDEQGVAESRLYYNVIGTADKELRTDFGMRKDKNGWYLKESSNVKYRMMAQRAFGSPKLQEYNFPAGSATKGSDNVISPVGSIPRNKINNK